MRKPTPSASMQRKTPNEGCQSGGATTWHGGGRHEQRDARNKKNAACDPIRSNPSPPPPHRAPLAPLPQDSSHDVDFGGPILGIAVCGNLRHSFFSNLQLQTFLLRAPCEKIPPWGLPFFLFSSRKWAPHRDAMRNKGGVHPQGGRAERGAHTTTRGRMGERGRQRSPREEKACGLTT